MAISKTFLTAAALVAMLAGTEAARAAGPSASDAWQSGNGNSSNYKLTVINKTSLDLWITWYKANSYGEGQAGTQCIPPGLSNHFGQTAWQYTGTVVRAELKSSGRCGGDSLVDTNVASNVNVDPNGNMKVTVTAGSNNRSLSGSLGY